MRQKKTVLQLIAELGISHTTHLYPRELSGGDKQKVAIARAIIGRPPLLLADEPTGSLDSQASMEVIDLLNKINTGGTTILLATHHKNLFAGSRYRFLNIDRGKIVGIDSDAV